uniref:Uncharacterized protein n=1 Tax=Rhipicephalus appendiculatus TaxID=34631 RepID=A0A131YWI1_RHIAP
MRPINQPLVAGEVLVASSLRSDDTEDHKDRETRGRCDADEHHVCSALANGEKQHPGAMYAQNGDALDGAQPSLGAPLKRRRSEDGERNKRARGADFQRGCESDGDLPTSGGGGAQSTTPHHHHHHHHHKKATAATGAADEHHQPNSGDVHGVCTLEEGSLKLKISLHRPHAVTPDGLSPTGKPPSGDKAAHASSRPQSPLAKSEEERAVTTVSNTHSPTAQPISDSTVQKVDAVFPLVDSDCDPKHDVFALPPSPVSPLVVRKVELPKAPSPQEVASDLTKDSPITDTYDASAAAIDNAIRVDKQAICGDLQLRSALNKPVSNTAVSNATATSKAHHSNTALLSSGNHAISKELSLTMDTCAREHNSAGGRTRKSTNPGHYVAYQAPHNRRRLIQDTSKLRGKMRSPIEFPAPLESRKSPQSFHHVNMSVGQNGGRGFVNHNSILDHPSVHARMFPPPGASPARLASLLTSNKPQGLSAAKQSAVHSKAGTSSDVHQPLDLSKAVTKPTKMARLAQTTGNYVPPIMLFYMRSRSRQRLEHIVVKLWAKQQIPVRGRPRP